MGAPPTQLPGTLLQACWRLYTHWQHLYTHRQLQAAASPHRPVLPPRSPPQVGPRSIAVIVDGESHTLGGVVTDVAWLQ